MKPKDKDKKRRMDDEEEEGAEKGAGADDLNKAMEELDAAAGMRKSAQPGRRVSGSILERAVDALTAYVRSGGSISKADHTFEDPVSSYMGGDSDEEDTRPDKGARKKNRGQETMESEEQTEQQYADETEDEPDERETIVTGRTLRSRPANDAGQGGKGAFGARRTGLPDEVMRSRGRDADEIAKGHEDAMYEQLGSDREYSEVVEASPALERLTNVIARSHGLLMAEIALLKSQNKKLRKSHKEIRTALAKSLTAQANLMKSRSGGYANGNGVVNPGFIADYGQGSVRSIEVPKNVDLGALSKGLTEQESRLLKSRNEEALNAAMNDGEVDADAVAIYSSTGRLPVEMISKPVIQKYGIQVIS